jgi:hypothetical protein
MKELLSGVLALALAVPVQRIETEQPNRGTVKRVETSMNHLTVIELAEPVVMAAAGSPSFKIERQGNKVLIQPLEEGAATNLFIWTASNRFSYELLPAASVETMHFAIDQEVALRAQAPPPVEDNNNSYSVGLADDILRFGTPVRVLGARSDSAQVGIVITDVFDSNDELTLRYTVENRTRQPYTMGQPEVFSLRSPKSPVSLFALRNTQLDADLAKSIRGKGEHRVLVLESETQPEIVQSGQRKPGLLALRFGPRDSQPVVLRVVFPSNGSVPISITLVL